MIFSGRGILGPLPTAIGFSGSVWLLKRSAPIVFLASPFGSTDPEAATLITIVTANPSMFETDPNTATIMAVMTADPSRFETDPDAAEVITL